jgi:hypothetical protein
MINWLSTGLSSMGLGATTKPANPDILASLPSGQFYRIDSDSSQKIASKMLFPDSAIEIRKSTQPNNYLLFVERVFDDEEEDDEDDEVMFLIDKSLCFKTSNGELIEMGWTDPSDSEGYSYTWIADASVSKETITSFQRVCFISTYPQTLFTCMFERLHDRAFSSDKDGLKLADFILSLGNGTPIPQPVVEKQASPSTPKKAAVPEPSSAPKSFSLTATVPQGEVVAEAPGDLYIFDINQRQFIPQHSNVLFQLVRSDSDPFV